MRSTSYPRQALAVLLLSTLVGMGFTAAPAHAAGFCEGDGVNVVVDFQGIGDGVQQECVEDGAGKTAAAVFEEAGFELTPVGAFPGAACQVDELPADVKCQDMPPANAYWGLFVGKDGKWDYAPTGADQLKVKDGDFVGFAWQTSETPALPRVAASPGAEPSGAAAPRSADTDKTDKDEKAEQAADSDDGGLPIWVPVFGVVALVAGVGAVMVTRRREGA